MGDGPGLLRAILEAPADDAPRLIYADWLDEHGRPDRADHIRRAVGTPYPDPIPRVGPAPEFPDAAEGLRYRVHRGFAVEVEAR